MCLLYKICSQLQKFAKQREQNTKTISFVTAVLSDIDNHNFKNELLYSW